VNDISPILLIGIGFFAGTVSSILVLDMVYKGLMKRALDEVGRQYSRALDMIKNRSKKND
jgi:hypothetical protein